MACGAPNTSSAAKFYFLSMCVGIRFSSKLQKVDIIIAGKLLVVDADIFYFRASMTCGRKIEHEMIGFVCFCGREKSLARRTSTKNVIDSMKRKYLL